MSQKRTSLRWYLSSRVLVTTVFLFIILTVVELFLASWLERRELNENINRSNQVYANSANQFINSLTDQIESISQNSIVLNALFDLTGRDNYLPLYLETISIFGRTDIAVQLVDFESMVIDSNFRGRSLAFPEKDLWLNSVINENQRWERWTVDGAFFAQPVLNRGFAEGAILVFIDAEVLSEGLANINPGYDHQLATQDGDIVYSKALNSIDLADKGNSQQRIFSSKQTLANHTLNVQLSIASPKFTLPSNAFLPLILASIALLAVSIISILNMSVKRINEVLSRLSGAISQVIKSQDLDARVDNKNSPRELAELGDLFNLMVAKLQATTTSRNEMNSIVQCMGDLVYVCDENMNVALSNQKISPNTNARSIIDLDPEHEIFDNSTEFVEYEQDVNGSVTLWRRLPLMVEHKKQGWILTGSDISEIRSAEQQMRLLKMAIDSSSNGIVIVDGTTTGEPIVFANRSFTEITGFDLDEILGRKCNFLQGEKTEKATRLKIKNAIIKHEPVIAEILNYRKNGEAFWNRLAIDPVFNNEGGVTHFLGVLTDISEEVDAREELKIAKESAELAAKAKSDFLATMSHEIRTPMNGVLGMLGVLLTTGLNDEQQHRARIAQSSAQSLLVLINDILDFSKIEAGKLELESLVFDPRHMLGELSEVLAHQAQAKGLELVLDVTGIEASEVVGDSGRIRQVVTNLISNAIKFTHEGEIVIQVGLFEEEDHWRMCGRVIDTGIGIAAGKTAKLFDAFSQVDASTTREYGGTGLGLAIVRLLCELMDGSIRVMSEEGRGSIFEFEFSLQVAENWQPVMPPLEITEKRILIVDNNQTNLDVLRGQLKHWGAYVECAKTARSAEEILAAKRITPQRMFDLAMIDLQLPDNGAKLLADFLQSDEAYREIKIVGMSPMGTFSPAKMQDDYQFDTYFPKPATTDDLSKALLVLSDDAQSQASKELLLMRLESHQNTLANFAETQAESILRKILVVDDNPINQEVALGILEGFGLTAECAEDGKQALDKLKYAPEGAPYTFVLMDCQMPVLDGYQASTRIRQGEAGERYLEIPILAMTANAMTGDREKCLAAGMSDYIAKPVDPMLLNQKLKQWAEQELSNSKFKHSPKAKKAEVPVVKKEAISKRKTDLEKNNTAEVDTSIWDQTGLLKRIGNNEALLNKLQTLYLNEQGQRLSELEQAVSDNDFSAIQAAAHTIKGVCANMNAYKTQQAAAELESSIKENKTENIQTLVAKLIQAEKELVAIFEKNTLLATENSDSTTSATLSRSALQAMLEAIYQALSQHEFIDAEDYQKLKQPVDDEALHQQLSQLLVFLEQFEHEASLALLENISEQHQLSLKAANDQKDQGVIEGG